MIGNRKPRENKVAPVKSASAIPAASPRRAPWTRCLRGAWWEFVDAKRERRLATSVADSACALLPKAAVVIRCVFWELPAKNLSHLSRPVTRQQEKPAMTGKNGSARRVTGGAEPVTNLSQPVTRISGTPQGTGRHQGPPKRQTRRAARSRGRNAQSCGISMFPGIMCRRRVRSPPYEPPAEGKDEPQ